MPRIRFGQERTHSVDLLYLPPELPAPRWPFLLELARREVSLNAPRLPFHNRVRGRDNTASSSQVVVRAKMVTSLWSVLSPWLRWGWWCCCRRGWDSGVVETDDGMVGTGMKATALRQTDRWFHRVCQEKKIEKDALGMTHINMSIYGPECHESAQWKCRPRRRCSSLRVTRWIGIPSLFLDNGETRRSPLPR